MYLPELEAVRRWLVEHAVGRKVRALHVASSRVLGDDLPWAASGEEAVPQPLEGAEVRAVERVGRHLLLTLGGRVLGLVVRGRGELYVGRASRDVPPYWRLAVELESQALWLCDRGSAARAVLVEQDGPRRAEEALRAVDAQGVEPLCAAFTLGTFKKVLRRKRRSIFRLLVDGQQIAGIGDTYADEILYASRVRPTRPAQTLGDDEIRTVYYSILEVLQKAIRFGGISSEQQPYVEGQPGGFGRFLSVHDRKGAECAVCRGRIRAVPLADLQAFYCPRCQR